MFKKEIKNGLCSIGFYVACAIILYLFLHELNNEYLFDGNKTWDDGCGYLYYVSCIMAFSGFSIFACIFASLPSSVSFCEEYNSGYLPFILHRSGFKRYWCSKFFGVGTVGGLTLLIPTLIIFLLIIIFSHPESADIKHIYSFEFWDLSTVWAKYVTIGGGLPIMGMKLILIFVYGFLWALVPIAISTWLPNRYVTLIAPYVINESVSMLLPKSMFNPLYLLRCDFHLPGLTFELALLIQFSYIALTAVVFYFGLKRRIPDV